MSGTSCDGLDCCDVDIDIDIDYNFKYKINKFSTISYTESEKGFIHSLRINDNYKLRNNEQRLTEIYIDKIDQFIDVNDFDCIACHGQTVQHIDKVISIQLLDSKLLFDTYKIPIISNFREQDIKNGGNGAPLMPFLDWLLFKNMNNNIITLNIGGISNITFLSENGSRDEVVGFDVGPGMSLVDKASKLFYNKNYDCDAELSIKGSVDNKILEHLMSLSYLKMFPPKSTDVTYFGETLLKDIIDNNPKVKAEDIIRTLVQYTVECIRYSIEKYIKLNNKEFILIGSGGGVEHPIVVEELLNFGYKFRLVSAYSIHPSNKEALLIATMGACKVLNLTNNMPSVTGSNTYITLGDIYNG